jgi:cobyrinic acid a,c-diamide synthase
VGGVTARVLLAAPHSGSGKTTLTAAVLAALTRRGLAVQSFKTGPDYIDPGYHRAATGRACRNLDPYLAGEGAVREAFARAMLGIDLAVVEGAMGLFDGHRITGEASAARVAVLLGLPVVLVVDARGMGQSGAPLLEGFHRHDPGISLSGVIFNRVGGEGHRSILAAAARDVGVLPLGFFPTDPALALPERHLGLVPAAERELGPFLAAAAAAAEAHLDLDALLQLAGAAPALEPGAPVLFAGKPVAPRMRLGVARDLAFGFYYPDSLDLLAHLGAELVPFSPLVDRLPEEMDALYLGGGFPELFAGELAANRELLAQLRLRVGEGLPVYAECGGLLYLARALDDGDRSHALVGVLPGRAVFRRRRQQLGYREATSRTDSLLWRAGERLRAHEFHWSSWDPPEDAAAYDLGAGRLEGYARGSVLASFLHLDLLGFPEAARRLVAAGAAHRRRRRS